MVKAIRWTDEELLKYEQRSAALAPEKKRSKYGAVKTTDPETGGKIDSKREAKKLAELRVRLRAGEFDVLATQAEFSLEGSKYIADFLVGRVVTVAGHTLLAFDILDSKGIKTAVYSRSKRQMAMRYGINIEEV